MSKILRAYLAGPDVFLPDPMSAAESKKKLCSQYGFEGVFPLDTVLDLEGLSKHEQGLLISRENEKLIRSCALVVANMTPFRGPSLDVGTAYEMGFARALGLLVFAYTNDSKFFIERVEADSKSYTDDSGKFRDSDDMEIEDFGMLDNLMLEGAVHTSGGKIVHTYELSINQYYKDLSAFEACLRQAQSVLSP